MKNELEQKIYRIDTYDREEEVVLRFDTYNINDSLAVSLYCRNSEMDTDVDNTPFDDLFGVITVNLRESVTLPFGTQFVDVNNFPGIHKWLIDNNIAEPTPICARSGFCVYPAFKFKLPEEWVAKIR